MSNDSLLLSSPSSSSYSSPLNDNFIIDTNNNNTNNLSDLDQSLLLDDDILKSVWEGKIPVLISLVDDEYSYLSIDPNQNKSKKLFTFVSRLTYLPLITSQVRSFFSKFTEIKYNGFDSDIWFEFNNIPLKWHYPVGLLYDILNPPFKKQLPWNINIHFSSYPSNQLIKLNPLSNYLDSPKDHFMSLLKEADYLKNGNVKTLMSLSKLQQNSLWESLWVSNFSKFWTINKSLILNNNNLPINFPIKLYLSSYKVIMEPVSYLNFIDNNTDTETETENENNNENENIDEDKDKDKDKNVKDVNNKIKNINQLTIYHVIQSIFKSRSKDEDIIEFLNTNTNQNQNLNQFKYIIHGIEINHNIPIIWLYRNFSYPDNFLHIVITI